jgi:hypothetical protein
LGGLKLLKRRRGLENQSIYNNIFFQKKSNDKWGPNPDIEK